MIKGLTDGVPQGEIQKDGPRGTDSAHDVEHESNTNSGYSTLLEPSGDQSDGLMVSRSGRDQENRIHAMASEAVAQVIGHLRLQPLRCRRIPPPSHSHGVFYRRHPPDEAFLF
jgi:hypothetical protein